MSSEQSLKSIFYVDDEADMRMLAQLALEAMGGFVVTLCDSGSEALACAKENPPQLILLDVMMPELDGLQTLKALQSDAALSSIPVVFMTAKATADDVKIFMEKGALGVIAKPFDPTTLAQTVDALWQGRGQH